MREMPSVYDYCISVMLFAHEELKDECKKNYFCVGYGIFLLRCSHVGSWQVMWSMLEGAFNRMWITLTWCMKVIL